MRRLSGALLVLASSALVPAFVTAMHYSAIGSAVFAVLGAAVAFAFLPGKRPETAPAPTNAEGLAEEQGVELVDVK